MLTKMTETTMVKAHCLSVKVRDQAWRRRTCLPTDRRV